MTDLELIFTMFGEASTTEITVQQDAQGFQKIKKLQSGWKNCRQCKKRTREKSGRRL